jgi:gas vesicle protein
MGTLALGMIIGGLVGVAAAMLSAPQSGAQTRALLRDKSNVLMGKASTSLQETRSRASDMLSKVRSRASELTQRNKTVQLPEEVREIVV